MRRERRAASFARVLGRFEPRSLGRPRVVSASVWSNQAGLSARLSKGGTQREGRVPRGCFHLLFDDYFSSFPAHIPSAWLCSCRLHVSRGLPPRSDTIRSRLRSLFGFFIYISQPLMLILPLIPLCLAAPPFTPNTDRRCETKGGGRVEEELNRRSQVSGKGREKHDSACFSC